MRSWKLVTSSGLALALAGVLCVPVWAQQVQQAPAGPPIGMVNYVEGQATLGTQALTEQSVGSAQVRAGQTLATQNGRAEILLTPGVLMRLDNSSAVTMTTPGIPDTEMAVSTGRAMVEADQILPANHVIIHMGPASVRLLKNGLYDFDAAHGQFRVFDGQAEVSISGKTYHVQGGHQFAVNTDKLKARGFDKKASEDAFYRWSSLRSSYLAEANADAARGYAYGYYGPGYGYPYYAAYGPYGYGPGWFWDPYFDAYTWLPWDGIFYSPFGWGFYSPGFVFAAPVYGFRGGYHNFGPGYTPSVAPHSGGSMQVAGNGFRGGGSAAYGGGFAGGGGFRGGGFSGGFHGGRR